MAYAQYIEVGPVKVDTGDTFTDIVVLTVLLVAIVFWVKSR